MNKLFTKVAALTLGVAMAAGVGVALGSAKASEAKAADDIVITFPGNPSSYTNAYTKSFSITSGNVSFTFANWNNGQQSDAWTAIRGVRKNAEWTGTITSGLISSKVSSIVVNVSQGSSNLTATKLEVASDSGFTTNVQTINLTADATTGEKTYAVTNTVENSYYRITHTASSASGNGGLRIDRVTVNYDGATPATQYNVTDSVENGSVSPSKVNEGATLTATITPDNGYNVPETVSVTMGGVAVAHTYQNGVVTVENVTGDVVITGSCVEIPVTPEPAVVETTLADFINATDADYTKAYHFTATIKAFKSGDTKDKYGNMTLTDGTNDLAVYGSTADSTKLVWNGTSAKYEFTNPQDFLTTELTNNSNVGDTVEVKFVRYIYSNKLNGQGIILDVTPGETPEIPEPEMVTGKKLSDLFADTAGNGKQLYEVTGVVSAWKDNQATDGTQYGNFYLKESLDSDTQYYIYGATADATKLVWGTASGVYSFTNPKDFLTNDVTKDVVIGSTLTMRLTRCDYGQTLEATGIVVSVVPPAPADWSDEVKTSFGEALDGFVPPYLGEVGQNDPQFSEAYVSYTVQSDVLAAANSYFTENQWTDKQAGNWYKRTTNGHIDAYVAAADGNKTFFGFEYLVDVKVTLVQGTYQEDIYVEPGEYTLPQPDATHTPEGKVFDSWLVGDVSYNAGAKVNLSADTTVTAQYVNAPQTAWTEEQSSAMSTALEGYVPPFYGAIFNDEFSVQGHVVMFTVYGDFSDEFAASLGEGWTLTEGKYYKDYQEGQLIASISVEILKGDPAVSCFTFEYKESVVPVTDWSADFKETYAACFGDEAPLPAFINADLANDANITWYYPTYKVCIIDVEANYFSAADDAIYGDTTNWSYIGNSKMYSGDYAAGYIYEGKDESTYCTVAAYYDNNMTFHTTLIFQKIGGITVETEGAKLEYFVGDNLDTTNIVVHFTLITGDWANGLNITSYCTFSPTVLDTAGDEIVITVDIAGLYERSYKVKVSEVVMESISISGELSKTEYTEGDAWDATGLVATAHYNNGAEEDVTAQVSWTFQPEETVAGTDSVSVVATLGEISSEAANFDVVVNEPAPAYDADAFAKELLEKVAPICANYDGKKNNKTALKGVWTEMALKYETLSEEEKAKVVEAAAKTDGTDLEKAMAFYNYACKKYGLTKFIAGRQVKAIVNEQVSTGNSILPIIVIVAASVTAVTAIGVVIALKRRKNFLTK